MKWKKKGDHTELIYNDPNAWAKEHQKPRYILDLILSLITVSLKTQEIIESLPEVSFE